MPVNPAFSQSLQSLLTSKASIPLNKIANAHRFLFVNNSATVLKLLVPARHLSPHGSVSDFNNSNYVPKYVNNAQTEYNSIVDESYGNPLTNLLSQLHDAINRIYRLNKQHYIYFIGDQYRYTEGSGESFVTSVNQILQDDLTTTSSNLYTEKIDGWGQVLFP